MKLQKQAGTTYTNKAGNTVSYDKWVVVLPPEIVAELRWKEGLDLRASHRGRGIVIEPASDAK